MQAKDATAKACYLGQAEWLEVPAAGRTWWLPVGEGCSHSNLNCNTVGVFGLGVWMDRQGKHLDWAERAVVFSEDQRGSSRRQIARLPGRAASTICREPARDRPEGRGGA